MWRGQLQVVSKASRKKMNILHVSYRGVISTKIKAREYFYCPNLNIEIEKSVSRFKIYPK